MIMEHLTGQMLVRKNKETVLADDALGGKEIIGFYFSAHWCPPCRMFTPILADFYEELTEASEPFEVIFVSSDRSEDALFDYMNEAHGDWLAVPHGSPVADQIKRQFGISGIPALIIVKKDGSVITESGRKDVESQGARAYKEWAK